MSLQGARAQQSDILNTPEALHNIAWPQYCATIIASFFQRGVNTSNYFQGYVYQDNLAIMQASQQTHNNWVNPNTGEQYPYPPKMSVIAAQFNAALALVEGLLPGSP